MTSSRPDPDALLARLKNEEQSSMRGRLKIFFGAVAGVGKTYSMLETAKKLTAEKVDLVVGYVETHGRQATEALLEGLEILPPKLVEYKGTELREFDIDAALARKPQVILVDELAHTNAPGSRHAKRWQDVTELLEAGIDVLTTMNVQHLESLHDVVAQITKVSIRERVPDSLLEKADEIELVDLPPDELLERLREGKIYIPQQAATALENFFRKGNLMALRELALRYTAERVDADMEHYRQMHAIRHPWPAAERIVVCVSPSPFSLRLVRAGKRMAEALRAKWTVLYVEGPRQSSLPDEDKHRLAQSLRLAEQLGAETLELTGTDVPEEIVKYANGFNASKIIIGKPARPRWREIIFGSVVDDVIRQSGAIDVYVITGEGSEAVLPGIKKPVKEPNQLSGYVGALLLVIFCTLLSKLILPRIELANVAMIYLLGVVLVAVRYGRGPSIAASILSVAAFDFFCVPPILTFAVSDTQYLITFAVMLVVGLVISTLTVRIQQQAESARLRATRTAALYSMSRELSSNRGMTTLVQIGLRHIATVFDCQVALFFADAQRKLHLTTLDEPRFALSEADNGIAAWVHQNRQLAGLGTNTLPGASALYLPVLGGEKNLGALAVRPFQTNRFMSPEQLRLLETFVNQLAFACERAQLSEESEHARLQVQTEQLRSSLLSSVSHDLRTPLATISGAASSILEASAEMNVNACKEMVQEIYDESMRMNRLVSNLLEMTKVQSGTLHVKKELHPVDEVIGTALSYMEERLAGRSVTTKVSADLPLIAIDDVLIQQVLVNLLENVIKYTPRHCEVEVSAEAQDDRMVVIAIADRGPGVQEDHKNKIFEKFYRERLTSSTGAGLGLAICSGIVEAHGGMIWVEDRPGGGAIFKFTVPRGPHLSQLELDEQERLARDV